MTNDGVATVKLTLCLDIICFTLRTRLRHVIGKAQGVLLLLGQECDWPALLTMVFLDVHLQDPVLQPYNYW